MTTTTKTNVIKTNATKTSAHRHRVKDTAVLPFFGPVSRRENRAAHGGVCLVDHCACGARRMRNVNGRHLERGDWYRDGD